MKYFNIAYFGSSDFSADFLEKILTDTSIKHLIEVKFVVTQPDRLVGRKQVKTPTPVKTVAQKNGLKVLEIENLKLLAPRSSTRPSKSEGRSGKSEVGKIRNLDLCFLYAYGAIIPQELLSLPKYGFWCLHPSLLPKYRGTSPMATALINGDKETGVTIIKMDDQIDHGPIIVQEKYQILPTDRRPDLEKKLTELGFQMFRSVILNSFQDLRFRNKFGMTLKEQNHQQATYTKKLKKEDGFIPFNLLAPRSPKGEVGKIKNSPEEVFNLFRGLFPWPGLWTLLRPPIRRASEGQALKRLKITDIDFINGKIIIKKVQLEGKKEVDFETFKKAYQIFN